LAPAASWASLRVWFPDRSIGRILSFTWQQEPLRSLLSPDQLQRGASMRNQMRRTLLSLAGLGIFLLLAYGSEFPSNKNSSNKNGSNSNRSVATNAGITTYVNSKSSFTGKLEEHYVDFSFDYPSSWKRDPEAGHGSSPNFVKVEAVTSDEITTENFAVGSCRGPLAIMPSLADQLSKQFSAGFPEYKQVSEGEVRVAGLDGYEFRFTGHSSKGKGLDFYGRVVLLPSGEGRKGAALIMLATSESSDVRSVEDIGEKGELPLILKSFKFGSENTSVK